MFLGVVSASIARRNSASGRERSLRYTGRISLPANPARAHPCARSVRAETQRRNRGAQQATLLNVLKVFRRREQAESKADFAAMPGAVHKRTRAARRKIQRGYQGADRITYG